MKSTTNEVYSMTGLAVKSGEPKRFLDFVTMKRTSENNNKKNVFDVRLSGECILQEFERD